MPREWVLSSPWPDRDALARSLRISPIMAQVLHNRGITDLDSARVYLDPPMSSLHEPENLPGATQAAERIAQAVSDGRKIVIYGDYDVDGITGAAIFWHVLNLAGAKVDYYVPHRLEEGYGVNADAIAGIADDGASMIVTVDCGVTAVEPAETAKQRGVEFIITDHHQPRRSPDGREELPDAVLVHPSIARNGEAPYGNPHLSGAGVALKVAWAIAQRMSNARRVTPAFRDFLMDAMGLAALGTLADVVPLQGENRVIARHGLKHLVASRLPGLRALIETSRLTGKSLSGYDIGFKLAPRLNAIGRMGHARLAVEMLTRASPEEAARIARNLDEHNSDRQRLQQRIAREARDMVVEQGQNDENVRGIVLASSSWHAGVIGIVASGIMQEFGRPTVMIAMENGIGQGSGRSIRNFPLHEVFAHCGEHLMSYGGHAMAAGLKLDANKIDEFRCAFQKRAGQLLTPTDLKPKLDIDDVADLSDLTPQLVAEFAKCEPHGAGNPSPRLATGWLELSGEPRTVGSGGTHLQVTLTDGRIRCKGIGFGLAKHLNELMDHRRCRVAFEPILNEWQGRTTVEMKIIDFQFPVE